MFLLHAHLVFLTKYRHPVFTAPHLDRMQEIMRAVCAGFGTELAEFNGGASHVHLVVNFPPALALSRLVNSLKGVSSRRLRQEFPDLAQHCWRANRLCPTSPDRPAAPPSPPCASTSSSRTARLTGPGHRDYPPSPPARRPGGLTDILVAAGALTDILVALAGMGYGQADQADREMMALALGQARASLEAAGCRSGRCSPRAAR